MPQSTAVLRWNSCRMYAKYTQNIRRMFFTIQHEFAQNSCQIYRRASLALHWMLINYNQTLAFTTQYVSTAFLDNIILHSIGAHWHDTLSHSSSSLNKSRASPRFVIIYRTIRQIFRKREFVPFADSTANIFLHIGK